MMSRFRFVNFTVLCFLVLLQGLLVTVFSSWSWHFDTSNRDNQQALHVNSSETIAVVSSQRHKPPKNLLLFIAVLTHASRTARRDAIRESWFTGCKRRTNVRCVFFTDNAGLPNATKLAVLNESQVSNDMVFLSAEGKS